MEQYLTPMGPTKLHVNPIFEISPLEPRFSEWLVFEGLSIDEHGRQHFLDASVAYKRAVLNCIHYLSKFGYTKQQVLSSLQCPQPPAFLATSSCLVLPLVYLCYCSLQPWGYSNVSLATCVSRGSVINSVKGYTCAMHP